MLLLPVYFISVGIYSLTRANVDKIIHFSATIKVILFATLLSLSLLSTYYISKDTFMTSILTSPKFDVRYFQVYLDSTYNYYESFVDYLSYSSLIPRLSYVVVVLAPLVVFRRKKFGLILIFLLWFAINFALSVMSKGFQGRYLYYSYPFYLILLSTSVYLLITFFSRSSKFTWGLLVGIFLFLNIPKGIVATLREKSLTEMAYGMGDKVGLLDSKTGIVHRTDTTYALERLGEFVSINAAEDITVVTDNRASFMFFYSQDLYQDVVLWNTVYGPQHSLEDIINRTKEGKTYLVLTDKTIEAYGSALKRSGIEFEKIDISIDTNIKSAVDSKSNVVINRTYYVSKNDQLISIESTN
jgi:hypothetical protein